MRRPCSDCGYAGGQRLLSQPDIVFYAGPTAGGEGDVFLKEAGVAKKSAHHR